MTRGDVGGNVENPRSARLASEAGYTHGDDDGAVVVGKEGHADTLDPHNWPLVHRSANVAVLSLLIFSQGWAGAADSMGNTAISHALHVGKVAENLSQAMYLLGIGCGCLFVGPLSETVGRNPTYLASTLAYLFFLLGSALTPTFAGQVVCRYCVGLFASATLGINGASVGDQFRPVKRAFVFPVIAWANVAAPMLAPVAGGWIVSTPSLGWRWCEWTTLIISSFAFFVAVCFLPETYLPVLMAWKARHLRRVTGDEKYVSTHGGDQDSFWSRLRRVLPMPVTYFSSEPVVAVLGGYLVLLYVIMFSFLSGFDYIFKETYGLSDGQTGSCFASIAAGSTAFTLGAPVMYRWARRVTHDVAGATVPPEFRLWPAILTSPLLPISLFWLGWSARPDVSIWSGLAACFCFGVVCTAMYVASYEYIVDSYGGHAAVALASVTMARYLVAAGMVMAVRPMYEGIGVHWTLTLLGCVATILTPAPFVFWRYGPTLRERSPYAQ
jgi:MFS family permease